MSVFFYFVHRRGEFSIPLHCCHLVLPRLEILNSSSALLARLCQVQSFPLYVQSFLPGPTLVTLWGNAPILQVSNPCQVDTAFGVVYWVMRGKVKTHFTVKVVAWGSWAGSVTGRKMSGVMSVTWVQVGLLVNP